MLELSCKNWHYQHILVHLVSTMPGAFFLFPLAVIDPPGNQKQEIYFSWPYVHIQIGQNIQYEFTKVKDLCIFHRHNRGCDNTVLVVYMKDDYVIQY